MLSQNFTPICLKPILSRASGFGANLERRCSIKLCECGFYGSGHNANRSTKKCDELGIVIGARCA
jgi:hypothetical protein